MRGTPVNAARLWQSLLDLASITDADRPYTRRAFTQQFVQGRAWLRQQFERAGLACSVDAGGNLVGRRDGRRDRPPIVIGSHSDTVVGGGRFDGIAGVLAGLEVAHALHEAGAELEHPLEIIDFLSEEPSDYGVSCVGSRALAGCLTPRMLQATNDAGETLAEAIGRMGGDAAQLQRPIREPGSIAAFVELHIEQGPQLEAAGKPIGIVAGLVGLRRIRVTVFGRADHAGTTPLDMRRDALVSAAHAVTHVNELARAFAADHTHFVATVGQLNVQPNNSNVVADRVVFTIDVRSPELRTVALFLERLDDFCRARGEKEGCRFEMVEVTSTDPTQCANSVLLAVRSACQAAGVDSMTLISGAGHDTAYLSRLGPAGMIFVPSRLGRSHTPDEWTDPALLATGTDVLYHTLWHLDAHLIA